MASRAIRPKRPEISVRNLQRSIRVDLAPLKKFAERALDLCLTISAKKQNRLNKLREIAVLLISDRRMAALHRRFMDRSGPTDVITFQHGEIFISADTARRHAREFGSSLRDELQLYIVHGLLHLRGFDDRNKTEARKMEAIQRRIVSAALKSGFSDSCARR